MSVFDCSGEMSKFHDSEVTLNGTEQTNMRERRNIGRERLKRGLEEGGFRKPSMIKSQGSYAMHTMVQDDGLDYDIDDGTYFQPEALQDIDENALTPEQARHRVCDALSRDQRFSKAAEVHTNCVRQEYAEGYHIDMPVYRIMVDDDGSGNVQETYELASGDAWEPSDARAVTRWFKDEVGNLNGEDGDDGCQMRRIVRLTKTFARSREEWKEETSSGILLTRLVVDDFKAVGGRDDESLLMTWKAIHERLLYSTVVEHPVNDKNLAGAHDSKVSFFRDCLDDALKELLILEEPDCTRGEARAAWDSVFNTAYMAKCPDPTESGGANKALFIATGRKTDSRDDGNGRFG